MKLHEVLDHDFIKRGEVKFSWSTTYFLIIFFRDVKFHEVIDFLGEVKWTLVSPGPCTGSVLSSPQKKYCITYTVNRCELGSLQTSSSVSSSSSSTRGSSPSTGLRGVVLAQEVTSVVGYPVLEKVPRWPLVVLYIIYLIISFIFRLMTLLSSPFILIWVDRQVWKVDQTSFITGSRSVNKQDLIKNLKFFNVTEDIIQSIYSKLEMRVFDVCVNILKCMSWLLL
jgi:hypothetical protein